MTEYAQLSTTDAAKLIGRSSRYVQKLIQAGKLSATRVSSRKLLIDPSEFFRVFPEAEKSEYVGNIATAVRESGAIQSEAIKSLESQNELLLGQLVSANTEKLALISALENLSRLLAPQKRKKIFGIF